MWADNETTSDLLGFKVHSDLVLDEVTDPKLLPVVLGVFGDWGSGKSSIMRMLEADLNNEKYKDVACLYFNGWVFEGYEDAKSALLTSILLELAEHKRFGAEVKDKVVGLLKRVQWMELGKAAVKHVGVPLAMAAVTGGMGAIPAVAGALLHTATASSASKKAEGEKKDEKPSGEEKSWLSRILADPTQPDLLEVRKFREEFEAMLEKTSLKSLVILIDDLDRCLPPRIIETLEAIKLFVAVKRTAFVIGADPRIVEHAIATQYARPEVGNHDGEEYDLTKDYLEKLIQVPYHLPRLSPAEMETYINLLLCEHHLTTEQYSAVSEAWKKKRQEDFYSAFTFGDIRSALTGTQVTPEFEQDLTWSNAVSHSLTEGLKGNPRQVKRMLNAMLLRSKLAKIAGLEIRPEVLAKLMVLEYTQTPLFKKLDDWQTVDRGFPKQLQVLEAEVRDGKPSTDETLSTWRDVQPRRWLEMDPALSAVDLRDYFWIARDRTRSTLSRASLVSPHIKRFFTSLVSDNRGEVIVAAKQVKELETSDREQVIQLLHELIQQHPDQEEGPDGLVALVEEGIESAARALLTASLEGSPNLLTPTIAAKLATIARTRAELKIEIITALQKLEKHETTGIGKAAKAELKGLK